MLDKLKSLFWPDQPDAAQSAHSREETLRVATAALLVEMSRADFNDDPAERAAAERLIAEYFELDAEDAKRLLGLADKRADEAVSLHEFTSVLHAELSAADKQQIIAMLWRVALADGRLDAHEEHLVRKIAGLLYVPNREAMRIKQLVAADQALPDGQ